MVTRMITAVRGILRETKRAIRKRYSKIRGSTAHSPTAIVDKGASIGVGTLIWHGVQIREKAVIGADCVVGSGAYIDQSVIIGDRCKVENNAMIFAPAVLGDGVFVGPGAVLTNDPHPRAITPSGDRKNASDWQPQGVVVEHGAAIGAGAVVLPGVNVGAWALVGAGAVVTRAVAPHALVVGTPARAVGWVGRAGVRLTQLAQSRWSCPMTGEVYQEADGKLVVADDSTL